MPFRWLDIFKQENDLAKAGAQRKLDAHADQHALVALTIRQLQDDHDKLEASCKVVMAEYTTIKEKLERDMEEERALDARGRAAHQAGHEDSAAAIAQQLVTLRALIATEQPAFDKRKDAAEKVQQAFKENGEALAAKMAEAKQLDAEIDEAAADENINKALKDVASMTSHTTPSFDEVRDRVHQRRAEAEAEQTLEASTPELSEIHEQHLVNVAAADDVMAGWGPTPVAASVGGGTGGHHADHANGSPTDRLNS